VGFDDFIARYQEIKKREAVAIQELSSALSKSFGEKIKPVDINSPEGMDRLIHFASSPFTSKSSFRIAYSALSGIWRVEIGFRKSLVETGGPNFTFALAVAILKYHEKEIPKSALEFVTFPDYDL
jgi:hypothetical protein